jgi:energy-coupling factor transporter ATP-binding protein EcfA2
MEQPTAPKPPGAAISARELYKRHGRRRAVSGLTFTVESGQICALLGPSGAGKASTMRMLVGLSRADSGSARLLGEPSRLAAGVPCAGRRGHRRPCLLRAARERPAQPGACLACRWPRLAAPGAGGKPASLPFPKSLRRVKILPVLPVDFFVVRGTQQQQVREGVTFPGGHVGRVAGRAGPVPVDVGDLRVLLVNARPYFEDDRHDAAGGIAAAVADRPEGGRHSRWEALALACAIALAGKEKCAPEGRVLRQALFAWAFNPATREQAPPREIALALGWMTRL